MTSTVGPVTFANPDVRAQLLEAGTVVTYRPERTTGRTWARWAGPDEDSDRLATAKADVVVSHLGEFSPLVPALERYSEESGLGSPQRWEEAIRGFHGDVPESGNLYRVDLEEVRS